MIEKRNINNKMTTYNFIYNGVKKEVKIIQYPLLLQTYPNLLLSIDEKVMAEADFIKNLKDTLNIDNFATSPLYLTEINLYNQYITNLIKDAIKDKGFTFDSMLHPDFDIHTPPTVSKIDIINLQYDENVPVKTLVKKDKVKVNLKKRIDDLKEGKILDVSKITSTGTKASAINYEKKKGVFVTKNKKVQSNNLAAFKLFVNMYPDGETVFEKELKRAEKFFSK